VATTGQRMPVRNPLIESDSGLITRVWMKFLRERGDAVDRTPQRVGGVSLPPGQHGDIAATPLQNVTGGFFRVSVYARRTVVATTSSVLGITIGWTEGGVQLASTAGNADNKVDAVITGNVLLKADPNTAITYEVNYDSVAADEMKYSLDIIVEQVQA
jgi:hypothetical protein